MQALLLGLVLSQEPSSRPQQVSHVALLSSLARSLAPGEAASDVLEYSFLRRRKKYEPPMSICCEERTKSAVVHARIS
jgi:hypothetical protein